MEEACYLMHLHLYCCTFCSLSFSRRPHNARRTLVHVEALLSSRVQMNERKWLQSASFQTLESAAQLKHDARLICGSTTLTATEYTKLSDVIALSLVEDKSSPGQFEWRILSYTNENVRTVQ